MAHQEHGAAQGTPPAGPGPAHAPPDAAADRVPAAPTLLELGLALLGALMALLLAIPVSCLPRDWREPVLGRQRLPLGAGTLISALLVLGMTLWTLGSVSVHWLTGGPTSDMALGWLLLLFLFLAIESAVRLLSILALGEHLGTALLWLLTRPLSTSPDHGPLATPHAPVATLPRARLLRPRPSRPWPRWS